MKKFRPDDYWFELVQGPKPDGLGFTRYFQVTCRRCKKQAKVVASGHSNEQIRKTFLYQRWGIGKTRFHHMCPDCVKLKTGSKPEPKEETVVEIPAVQPPEEPALSRMWDDASEVERMEFWRYLRMLYSHRHIPPHYAPISVVEPQPLPVAIDDHWSSLGRGKDPHNHEWQHGSHIDSMPEEAPLPEIESPPEVVVEDDEPADWWKELHKEK